jgi:hypothetical protein
VISGTISDALAGKPYAEFTDGNDLIPYGSLIAGPSAPAAVYRFADNRRILSGNVGLDDAQKILHVLQPLALSVGGLEPNLPEDSVKLTAVAAAPVPGAGGLLAGGLVVMGFWRRWRRNACVAA